MNIILNEKKEAERIIKDGNFDMPAIAAINLIARYWHQVEGVRDQELHDRINEFMRQHMPNYNQISWHNAVAKQVARADQYKLCEIDCVSITEKELEVIGTLGGQRLERVAFTLLCLAKYYNARNPNNNNWCNQDAKVIFSLSCTNVTISVQDQILHELMKRGLIEFSNKVSNTNIRVLFIDDQSEQAMTVDDFRKLGYEYEYWRTGGFYRCASCGILTKKPKKYTRKYCPLCAGYTPQKVKTVTCADCGCAFTVSGSNKRTYRCPSCQKKAQDRAKQLYELTRRKPRPKN